mgnify:FL=1
MLEKLLEYRRAVRRYSKTNRIDTQVVQHCLELAQLAPTSSNLQLWEAYHIVDPKVLAEIAEACFGQWSVKTAQEVVVFVTRQDLYAQRAQAVFQDNVDNIRQTAPEDKIAWRIQKVEDYYKKLVPSLYSRFCGLLGMRRKTIAWIVGFFRPIVREVSESDMNTVVHKSCALVAQTFMLAMAEQNYDTCPLEWFDSNRIKKILKLPRGAEVSLVVTCGIRDEGGMHGPRFRIPFQEQYKRI